MTVLFGSIFALSADPIPLGTGSLDLIFLVLLALATTLTLPGWLPCAALGLAVVIALGTAWLAIASAYRWNLPVGFFVGVLSALCYAPGRLRARGRVRLPSGGIE